MAAEANRETIVEVIPRPTDHQLARYLRRQRALHDYRRVANSTSWYSATDKRLVLMCIYGKDKNGGETYKAFVPGRYLVLLQTS